MSYSPDQIRKLTESYDTKKLYSTVLTQQAKVKALRKGQKPLTGTLSERIKAARQKSIPQVEHKPSLLSRIFDVISRPVYATTSFATERARDVAGDVKKGNILGALLNATQPVPDEDELKGIGQGLWGTRKESFSNTLKVAGVKNKVIQGIGGFIGDVALDPTTYLSFGATAAAKQGAKIAAKEVLKEGAEAFASKAAKELGEKAAMEAATKFAKLPKKEVLKLTKAARRDAEKSYAMNVMQELKKSKEGSDVTKFQMRFLGKPVVQSEMLGRAKTAIGAKIAERPSVEHFRKLFKTGVGLPEDVKFVQDMVKGQTFLDMDNMARQIKHTFQGTNKADRALISHALESGNINTLPQSLQAPAQVARDMMDNWAHIESVQVGALKPDKILQNYVYHSVTGKDAGKLKSITKKTMGTENPHFAKERKYGTILEVKDAIKSGKLKAEVDEDIASILWKRGLKHGEVTNRKAFVDELVNRFGVTVGKDTKRAASVARKQGLLVKPKSPYIPKDVLFDPEIASAITHTDNIILNDRSVHHFLKLFDKAQNAWKFAVTVPNPGFHVRNFMGDVWNNYLDGVVNPNTYKKGARLAASMEGESMPRLVASKMGVLVDRSGVRHRVGKYSLTGDELVRFYREKGLKSGFVHGEYGQTPVGARGVLHKLSQAGRGVFQVREDAARMTHFLDALKKEGKNATTRAELDAAAERAARRVQKFNFDYNDLTSFEQKTMRRIVPFYTWMRKNIPLQLEILATKPGRVAVLPKGLNALQTSLGMPPTENPDDPLSGLQTLIPKWLQEMAGVQVGMTEQGTPKMFAPQLPIQDITRLLENNKGGIPANLMAMLTPGLRGPAELAAGKTFYSGQDVDTSAPGVAKYLLQQTPQGRGLSGLTEMKSGDKSVKEIIMNTLGIHPSRIAGLYDVTPGQQRGELRRIQDPLQKAIHDIIEGYKRKALATAGSRP